MFPYEYELIRSRRKTISLQVTPGGRLVVRAPLGVPENTILSFLESKQSWIRSHLRKSAAREKLPPFTAQELKTLAEAAREDLPRRVGYWAIKVGVPFHRITIRAQRTRWGSSTSRGNLNFNCLLMLVPEEVRDYVVVHELCHQKQMNHSPAFWAEVERILPDYRCHRQWLKENGDAIIARLENPSD